MGLGDIFTDLFRPCSSAPKSPSPPNSPNKEWGIKGGKGCDLVTTDAVTDISNMEPTPSPQPNDKDKVWASEEPASSKPALGTSTEQNCPSPGLASPKKKAVTIEEGSQDKLDQLILEVFGFDVLQQLQGPAWDERGQAVQGTRARVVQGDLAGTDKVQFFHAACAVAKLALKDKVMPVFFDGLDMTKLLFGEFARSQELPQEAIDEQASLMIPIVVAKTSDRNARSIEATRQALVFLARQPHVGCPRVMSHILAPISNAKDIAAIRGRLELIGHVMDEFGFSKKEASLSLSTVMTFVRTHLDATDEKVRRAAVEVTVSCYSLKGDRTMKYCQNLKPALLKLLEQRFAEVDKCHGKGGSSKGGKKSSKSGLPEVRGAKVRKPLVRNPGFSSESDRSKQGSAGSSLGSRGTPLAPIRGLDSREDKAPMAPPSVDIFAHSGVLSDPSDMLRSPQPQYGLVIDPMGQASLASNEDPNFIPSPTPAVQADNDLDDDEQLLDGLMDEIDTM